MPPDRQDQVRDVARYLRDVRPLDPSELITYIDENVTEDEVRAQLRALAPELGLIERTDGTFTPPPDGELSPRTESITTLPARYEQRLEALLVDQYGTDWAAGDSATRLRTTIDDLKDDYYHQHPVEYDLDVAFAYAIYHLATYFAAGYHIATDLANAQLLDHELTLLDVGAGVGGPALGFMEAIPNDVLLDYHAVEPAASADILESLLAESPPNVHPTITHATAEEYSPDTEFDIILFGNVLIELTNPVAVVTTYLDALASDGTVVLLSPADQATSTGLRQVERTIVDEKDLATVYAPTVRLWSGEHPTDRGWSFTRKDPIAVPSYQAELAAGTDTYQHTSVQYSYAYLRTDGQRRYDITLPATDYAKMAAMDAHVTNRVDVVGAKLSPNLGADNPVYKVSDGSESIDHYAVHVHDSQLTDTLSSAGYGTLLEFENVLVLWNDDEDGYNLVVDDEAVVDYY